MRRMRALTGRVVVVLAVALAGTAAAEDWPRWCGPDGRNFARETSLPTTFVRGSTSSSSGKADLTDARNVRWAVRLSSIVYGNPTIADGRLFVGANNGALPRGDKRFNLRKGGVLQCRDEKTGQLLWQLVVPHPEQRDLPFKTNIINYNFGVIASPAVAGEKVYIITNTGDVLCLDVRGLANGNGGSFQDEAKYMAGPRKKPIELTAGDADILWRRSLWEKDHGVGIVPHDAIGSSPLVHGDLLYATTSNSVDNSHVHVPHPDAPSLIALDRHTGRLVATDNEKIGHRLWHGLWCSPNKGEVNGKTLIFFGAADGFLYAFEAPESVPDKQTHLKLVWKYDCNPPRYRMRDGKVIDYYSGDRRKLRKYKDRGNKNDGKFLGPSQIIATPVFHKNRVYVSIGQDPAHGNGIGLLHCIDATKTGDISKTGAIWTYDKIQRSISTVAIADGLIYAPDVTGTLHCLDADTGTCYWTHATRHEGWGGPLVADGKVYYNTRRSFWILAAGRKKKVLHSEPRVGSEASPVAANGVAYVVLKGWLWALERQKPRP